MKRIVTAADVKRSKKISVNIADFDYEYFRSNIATFKGCPLRSVNRQIQEVCNLFINKEVGAMKRSLTVTENRQQKIKDRNKKNLTKMEQADAYYKAERTRRIDELSGQGTSRGQGATPQSAGATGMSQGQQTSAPSTPQNPTSPRVASVAPQARQNQLHQNQFLQGEDAAMNSLSDSDF